MKDLLISTTDDYEALVPLFMKNGLEFSEDEPVPTDNVMCWKAVDEDGNLQGGAVLALREGEFICDGLAVNEEYRSTGAGKELMDLVISEAGKRGAKNIYIVAKVPKFFEKVFGYRTVEREDAPQFFECFTCPQYGISCHPEVMRYEY